jgi:F420-non-reducing hydrogenase iron-sulfur subunit
MCTGRLDVSFILTAFSEGADGVFIGGCHPGDCHYLSGNSKAHRRILLVKKLLPQFGISPERVTMEWISASEAQKLADSIASFTERIRKLGPNPLRSPRSS